jgi:hypothetical protein
VYNSDSEIKDLIAGFENCTLPRSEWTHSAHLSIAVWYLSYYQEPEAITNICEGIKKYNSAIGILNTSNSGYHETITQFWIRIVQRYLLVTKVISILHSTNEIISQCDKDLPLQYYSRDLLMSFAARIRWIEPDLKPL